MSNKADSKLESLDRVIRETIHRTNEGDFGEDGTLMSIEFVSGFEMFNTRPYHNYETWGDGYRITGRGVQVEKEDLDEAILLWQERVWEAHLRETQAVPNG